MFDTNAYHKSRQNISLIRKKKRRFKRRFRYFCLLCRRAVIVQRNHTDDAQHGNYRAQCDGQTGEDRSVYGGQEECSHGTQQAKSNEGNDGGRQLFHKFHR